MAACLCNGVAASQNTDVGHDRDNTRRRCFHIIQGNCLAHKAARRLNNGQRNTASRQVMKSGRGFQENAQNLATKNLTRRARSYNDLRSNWKAMGGDVQILRVLRRREAPVWCFVVLCYGVWRGVAWGASVTLFRLARCLALVRGYR